MEHNIILITHIYLQLKSDHNYMIIFIICCAIIAKIGKNVFKLYNCILIKDSIRLCYVSLNILEHNNSYIHVQFVESPCYSIHTCTNNVNVEKM